MTDTQLPKALQLAAVFDHPFPPDWEEMQAAAAELRRLHQYELAHIAWNEKTEWVQQTARPRELGMHRADVLKQRIEHLEAELDQARAALAAQGEPVGEVFTMEALGTPGKPFCHVLLNRTLPTGTKLYTAAPAKPMTDEQVTAAAKYLCNEFSADCNVDCDDAWMIHGEEFKESARRALMAAHNITDKGGA